jgi:DNA-binding XRE family transcriptional regulator
MALLRVKELMIKKNITRDELANMVDVSPTSISNICVENNYPKLELLFKIAEALDVDIRELFNPTKGGMISKSELNEAIRVIQNGVKMLDGIEIQ